MVLETNALVVAAKAFTPIALGFVAGKIAGRYF
jgi:hypothetical protein